MRRNFASDSKNVALDPVVHVALDSTAPQAKKTLCIPNQGWQNRFSAENDRAALKGNVPHDLYGSPQTKVDRDV